MRHNNSCGLLARAAGWKKVPYIHSISCIGADHVRCNNVTDLTDHGFYMCDVCCKLSRLSVNCVWHSRWRHANKIYLRLQIFHSHSLKLRTTAISFVAPISTFTKNKNTKKERRRKKQIMRFAVCRFLSAHALVSLLFFAHFYETHVG